MATTMQNGGMAAGDESAEVVKPFIPTPERVSQYLELKQEEVNAKIQTVKGREELYGKLLQEEAHLRQMDPNFDPAILRKQLDLAGEAAGQRGRLAEQVQAPEKKGMMRRAFDRVKGFAKKHPIITALLVAALVAAGVGGILYLSGAIQMSQAGVAIETITKFFRGTDLLTPGIGPMDGFNPLDGVPLGK